MHPDFFNDDAFSLVSLTAVINKVQHVPGRAGELAFAGVGEGVATTTVSFEETNESLTLIETSPRGGPAPVNTQDKRTVRALNIPHIKLEENIGAHQIQGVRALGSMDTLRGARSVVDGQIGKMGRRHDLTLENLRLGAVRGIIYDADGTTVLGNLFNLFGVTAPNPVGFDDVFVGDPTAETLQTVRRRAQEVLRFMKRNIKAPWPGSARVHVFCGDNFFDKLIESTSVKGVWDGWAAAERRMGDNYAQGTYDFAGFSWENYTGTDDQSKTSAGTVGIDPDEAQFFPVGVPGLFAEYYAPADFMDTVNTLGLPRYARVAPSDKFNRGVAVHTQQNPLPICTRPRVLLRGTSTYSSTEDGVSIS